MTQASFSLASSSVSRPPETFAAVFGRAYPGGGAISLIEVRDADRELLAAAAAFRALGGGWTPDATVVAGVRDHAKG